MRFYVASHISGKEDVQAIHARLRELGHEITVDWTAFEGVFGDDRNQYPEKVAAIAIRDMVGVEDCDVFVLLTEPPEGRAKYAELGAAIMSAVQNGKPEIFVIGDLPSHSVFFYHPTVTRVKTMDDVLAELDG